MAIVAVLAGIVSVAVTGTGETSKDTQTKQDATTVDTAAGDFFADQVEAEVLTPKTVQVLGVSGIRQITSSRWPEDNISAIYSNVFTTTVTGSTVGSLSLLTGEDSATPITPKRLLENYNAVDFDALIADGFMAVEPDGSTQLSGDIYSNYLWLLKRTTSAGGSSEGAARQVAVFKLKSVQKIESDTQVDLTYVQLVGDASDLSTGTNVVLADITVTEDHTPTILTLAELGDTFSNVTSADSSDSTLVDVTPTASGLTLTYLPQQNGTATIGVVGTDSSGAIVLGSFDVTITPVNDPPFLGFIPNVVGILPNTTGNIVVLSTVPAFPGPPIAFDEASQTLTYTASILSQTPASGSGNVVTIVAVDSATGLITYDAPAAGLATITVTVTDDGTPSGSSSRNFNVTVEAPRFTTDSLPSGTVSSPYSVNLAINGGTAPFAFAITTGTLPAGLNLNPVTAVISGTPTATAAATDLFTVTVTDAAGLTATKEFSIVVN